jgi:hypothetical protein
MKVSSLFFAAGLAFTVLSVALLLCGLSGTAMSQTATPSGGATTSLPGVVVEKPMQRAVARSTVSPRTSPTTATPTESPMSPAVRELAQIAKATGNCVGGCVTSFRSGDRPWVGCSTTSWPLVSPTCRNVGNYKTYAECTETGLKTGWRNNEVGWYCSSLALK